MSKYRILHLALVVLCCIAACGQLTSPDDGNINDLANGLRAMPAPRLMVVRNNKINDRLLKWAADKPDGVVGHFACSDRDDDHPIMIVNRAMIYALMQALPDATVGEIFDNLEYALRPQVEQKLLEVHDFEPCNLTWYEYDGVREWIQAWLDDESLDDDDVVDSAYWLPTLSIDDLRRRPALMGVLGLAVFGGAVVALPESGIAVALCALSRRIQCPDAPEAPGVPQYGQGGGDR